MTEKSAKIMGSWLMWHGSLTGDKPAGAVFLHKLTPPPAKVLNLNVHLPQLCLATATHNFKWVKIIHICLNGDQTFANLDV